MVNNLTHVDRQYPCHPSPRSLYRGRGLRAWYCLIVHDKYDNVRLSSGSNVPDIESILTVRNSAGYRWVE